MKGSTFDQRSFFLLLPIDRLLSLSALKEDDLLIPPKELPLLWISYILRAIALSLKLLPKNIPQSLS